MARKVVSYDIARKAKLAGFDWLVNNSYLGKTEVKRKRSGPEQVSEYHEEANNTNSGEWFSAPTYEDLREWLRESERVHCNVSLKCTEFTQTGFATTPIYINTYIIQTIVKGRKTERDGFTYESFEKAQEISFNSVLNVMTGSKCECNCNKCCR